MEIGASRLSTQSDRGNGLNHTGVIGAQPQLVNLAGKGTAAADDEPAALVEQAIDREAVGRAGLGHGSRRRIQPHRKRVIGGAGGGAVPSHLAHDQDGPAAGQNRPGVGEVRIAGRTAAVFDIRIGRSHAGGIKDLDAGAAGVVAGVGVGQGHDIEFVGRAAGREQEGEPEGVAGLGEQAAGREVPDAQGGGGTDGKSVA